MTGNVSKNAFELAKLTVPAFLLKEAREARRSSTSDAKISPKISPKPKKAARVFVSFDEAVDGLK